MKTYTIIRKNDPMLNGTHGTFYDGAKEMCVTFERPWLDNKKSLSCIPTGTYKCTIHISKTKGRCFKIHNVENRTHILIHPGNMLKDTEGCILVGSYSYIHGIRKSVYAMGRLLIFLPDKFNLEIK